MITARTRIVGILGSKDQVGLSLSPTIHNAAIRALGIDWIYLSFGVEPGELSVAVKGLAAVGVRGMNLTMPHKVAAIDLVDRADPHASAIGAVNTIDIIDGELVGWNTDAEGLRRFLLRDAGVQIEGASASVLGSGGAARSVVSALAGGGASSVTVVARNLEAAAKLESLSNQARFTTVEFGDAAEAIQSSSIVVNATPLGQKGDESPISAEWITPDAVVVDLVYRPPVTPLMAAARSRGAIAHGGLGMLLHQAQIALEIWTGMLAPLETMSAAAVAELGTREDG